MFGRERIEYKTTDQVVAMRRAGLVVAAAHQAVRDAIAPGVTTADLDAIAAQVIADAGATPSFLGYHGYPAVLCVSVNEEIVHGIPGPRVLREGDVVSVDCGAIVDGWHGDAAFTVVLDDADPADLALSDATERAMWAAVAALAGGDRLGVVGDAVEQVVAESAAPYGIVQEYVGHGIGTAMHQPPEVLNYRTHDRGSAAAAGPVRGDRADAHPRVADHPRARRRLDGGHRGRPACRPLGAHGRDRPGRDLGADRRGRRRGRPGPVRCDPRPPGLVIKEFVLTRGRARIP